MKYYTVQITDKALADMEEIYEYIALKLQTPENALGQSECFIVPPTLANVFWKMND